MPKSQSGRGRKAQPGGPASLKKTGVSFDTKPLAQTGSNTQSPHKTQSPAKSSLRQGHEVRPERSNTPLQHDDGAIDIDGESSEDSPTQSQVEDRGSRPTLLGRFDENIGRELFRARNVQQSGAGSDNNGKDELLVRRIEELKQKLQTFASKVPWIPETEPDYTDRLLESASQELVRYIGSIAMGGRDGKKGWEELLTDAEGREAIVMGVVARALKEHVFGAYLFGADEELRKDLESIDTSGQTHDGFVRTRERAALVNQSRIRAEVLAQDVSRIKHQLVKMLQPFWSGGDEFGRSVDGMGTKDIKSLGDIIKHAASIAHLIRRAPDVVYYWAPTFKDEEFEPASMEALNLATMIRTSPYDKVTDNKGYQRAVLREQNEKSEAIVRVIVFPAIVAYRQYGGCLAAAEIKVEKEGSKRLPPDVRDRRGQPITPKQGFRSKLISKSVVHLQWGKQMLLTKEAGTAAHLDAVRDGQTDKYSSDSAGHVELHELYEAGRPCDGGGWAGRGAEGRRPSLAGTCVVGPDVVVKVRWWSGGGGACAKVARSRERHELFRAATSPRGSDEQQGPRAGVGRSTAAARAFDLTFVGARFLLPCGRAAATLFCASCPGPASASVSLRPATASALPCRLAAAWRFSGSSGAGGDYSEDPGQSDDRTWLLTVAVGGSAASLPRFPSPPPAPPRPPPPTRDRTSFFDLPAELRIEIYKLALEKVTIHILPVNSKDSEDRARGLQMPHALTRTSRQVRNEVLPLMHASCPIKCAVTDFNFDGLLTWIKRVPPHEETHLKKNENLTITLHTAEQTAPKTMDSMRKWLKMRADKCRPQPNWKYHGSAAQNKIGADLRRRTKRMTEAGKQKEMLKILQALNIALPSGLLPDPDEEVSRSSSQPAADSADQGRNGSD
ncbi:hypothetical protein BST61_g7460 [Cercospora zeina]